MVAAPDDVVQPSRDELETGGGAAAPAPSTVPQASSDEHDDPHKTACESKECTTEDDKEAQAPADGSHSHTGEASMEQKGTEQHESEQAEQGGHVATADRMTIYSWGSESAPSPPSVDSRESFFSDIDSAIGSTKSSTVSLSESIYEFVEENGRTYHKYKEGKYHFPNDAEEQDRLDLQHCLFLMTVKGRLFLAPIKPDIQHVLDLGTGTGIWAIEFAQQYPGAEVIGTDLSPIQPQYVPPNCQFQIDDADDEWTWGPKFDFVHARAMCSCFSDHKKVIQACYDSLAPGGWCEWQDMIFPLSHVGPMPEDTVIVKWTELICEAAGKMGRPWHNTVYCKQYFEDAGFENIVERRFYWPMGPWAKGDYYKNISMYFMEDVKRGMEPITMKLFPKLGWTKEEIQVMLAKVRRDMARPEVHAYLDITFVYGQKPLHPKQPQSTSTHKASEESAT